MTLIKNHALEASLSSLAFQVCSPPCVDAPNLPYGGLLAKLIRTGRPSMTCSSTPREPGRRRGPFRGPMFFSWTVSLKGSRVYHEFDEELMIVATELRDMALPAEELFCRLQSRHPSSQTLQAPAPILEGLKHPSTQVRTLPPLLTKLLCCPLEAPRSPCRPASSALGCIPWRGQASRKTATSSVKRWSRLPMMALRRFDRGVLTSGAGAVGCLTM